MKSKQRDELIETLRARFEEHEDRHAGIAWAEVQAKLEASPDKLRSLHEMEETGGEPDVVAYDEDADEYVFYDCSPESPAGRRSTCYDRPGLESRKEHKPEHNAVDMAALLPDGSPAPGSVSGVLTPRRSERDAGSEKEGRR